MLTRIGVSISAALLTLAFWTVPAAADPPDAALRLYAAGRYLAAADTAERDSLSSESLAFAARSLLAACITGNDDTEIAALLDRAEHSAREALDLDSGAVDARLQLAVVYGFRGRRASLAAAVARAYAPRGRRLIEQVLALAPDSAQAHALLGAWHLEVLRRGGRAGALAYGARLSDGRAAFERALELAPDEPMIPLHYAIALIELDPSHSSGRAGELLAGVAAITPRDALDQYARAEALSLRLTLAREEPSAAARTARTHAF